MKKICVSFCILVTALLMTGLCAAQNNIITLKALPGGTEGTTVFTDSSILSINAFGGVTYNNSNSSDDWSVTASTVTQSGALNKTFSVTIGGMSTVNTKEGKNYGTETPYT